MQAQVDNIAAVTVAAPLRRCFDQQRRAYLASPTRDYEQRKRDLLALKRLVTENQDAIVEAISSDYGNRSRHETLVAEILPVTDGINTTIKHLRDWMAVQKRHVDRSLFAGGRNRVIPQPLGVVGLIVPWNFPINLAFSQLTSAFAAGNPAMVKMSENSMALASLLTDLSETYLPQEKLQFFIETGGVGIEFSRLPFDLMIFTGSGQTGRAVMAAAAENLTPVVLELGGKSPAIVDPAYPLDKAVARIMQAKQLNAGQICTNVDYAFVQKDQIDEFARLAGDWVAKHVPDIGSNDYTAIIDERSYRRLQDTLQDARDKGATIVNLCGAQSGSDSERKMPLYLVTNTSGDMQIRQRETFGPILMLLAYTNPAEVIDYVNAHDRPLAIYPFSNDRDLVARYIDRIQSGGVTVNDALLHVAQHDLPFGGVGPSGMGHYHGYDGFVACSKMRPVFYQARFSSMQLLAPPYGQFASRLIDWLVKFKA